MSGEQGRDLWERVDLEQVKAARMDLWCQYALAFDHAEAARVRQLIVVSLEWEAEVLRQLSLPLEQRDHATESVWEKVSK